VLIHTLVDDAEDLGHWGTGAPEVVDDLEVEAALALLPKEGEIGKAQFPYTSHRGQS
jgi:hypothetical protein